MRSILALGLWASLTLTACDDDSSPDHASAPDAATDGGADGAPDADAGVPLDAAPDTGAADTGPTPDVAIADGAPPDAGPGDPEYTDLTNWVCHPELADDPCDGDLAATIVRADGVAEVEPFVRAADPPVDCFYIYPTVSLDAAPNADLPVGQEEVYITVAQAARFVSVCEVYAPGYRQVSVGGLAGAGDAELSYVDVLAAFRNFAARDPARGFVLIGHSQGSARLTRLLAEEIETDDALHGRLVAAYLIGWNVAIPDDADVGGAFQRTPACRAPDQTGCVVSFATYRESDPPAEGALFGHVPEGRALCNHPAALAGGPAFTKPYFDPEIPANLAALFGGFEGPYTDPAANEGIETRYYGVPDLVEAECTQTGPFSFLSIRVHADPDDARIDDIGGDFLGGWGLHLADITLLYGDLVDLARTQTTAWLAR